MNIGCGLGAFARYGENRYEKMKEVGFDFAEIGIRTLKNNEDEDVYYEMFRKEKLLADKAGVTITQVHAPMCYPPCEHTDEERAVRFEDLKKSMVVATIVGAKNWIVHPLLPFYGMDEEANYEKNWKINKEFFKKLIPLAKKNNITICLENICSSKSPKFVTPEETIRFVHEINDDNFKFCLDTGHCGYYGRSPADSVRLAGNILVATHVHDTKVIGRDDHMLPYFGIIDWNEFSKSLKEINYNGVITAETSPPQKMTAITYELMLKAMHSMFLDIVK